MPPNRNRRSTGQYGTRDLSIAEKLTEISVGLEALSMRIDQALRKQDEHSGKIYGIEKEQAIQKADISAAHDRVRAVSLNVETLIKLPEWKQPIATLDKEIEDMKPTISFLKRTAAIAYPVIVIALVTLIWKALTTPTIQTIQVIVTATPGP